jgi:hypothetical protein
MVKLAGPAAEAAGVAKVRALSAAAAKARMKGRVLERCMSVLVGGVRNRRVNPAGGGAADVGLTQEME